MSSTESIETTSVVELTLNGSSVTVEVLTDELLLDTLRDRRGLTSVRGTCGIGVCGTCTVLLNDRPICACLTLTIAVAGETITTAEGLVNADGSMSDVQQAFEECQAYQCSFCIPAMTLSMHACIEEDADRTVDEVREYLGGNLCRCGTYPQILEAARSLLSDRFEQPGGEKS